MKEIKHSKQRESILHYLQGRTDHPTADMIYQKIREENPNISLGTVYRNLALLVELGMIQKIQMEQGGDRYDGNPKMHYHFVCTRCFGVSDIHMEELPVINESAERIFDGEIKGHILHYYGTCRACLTE